MAEPSDHEAGGPTACRRRSHAGRTYSSALRRGAQEAAFPRAKKIYRPPCRPGRLRWHEAHHACMRHTALELATSCIVSSSTSGMFNSRRQMSGSSAGPHAVCHRPSVSRRRARARWSPPPHPSRRRSPRRSPRRFHPQGSHPQGRHRRRRDFQPRTLRVVPREASRDLPGHGGLGHQDAPFGLPGPEIRCPPWGRDSWARATASRRRRWRWPSAAGGARVFGGSLERRRGRRRRPRRA